MEIPPGVYSTGALRRLGIGAEALRSMVRDGTLIRLRKGWYATPDAPGELILAARRGGALSCVSVLQRHGIWLMPEAGGIHIRPRRRSAPHRTDYCLGFGTDLPVANIEDPLPLALLYAARCLSREAWIVAADSVLNSNGWTVDELTERMADFVPVPVAVHRLLDRCDPRSQSGTETLVRIRLRAEGFKVEVQPRIAGVGHTDLRVGRLIIECDSEQFHSSKEQRHLDRRRDRKAIVDGQLPFRVDYHDVIHDWAETFADIRAVTDPRRHRPPRIA